MSDRTITALYRSKDLADEAKLQLEAAGIDNVDVHSDDPDPLTDTARAVGEKTRNFFEKIADFFGGHEDTHAYAEGLRRGNYLLTAKVDDGRAEQALQLLRGTDAVDVEREEQSWRDQGWSGAYEAPASSGSAGASDRSIRTADEEGADTRGTAGVQEAYQGTSSSGVHGAGALAGGLSGEGANRANDGLMAAPQATGSAAATASDPALERTTDGEGGPTTVREARSDARIRSYVVEGSAEEPGDYQLGGAAGVETAAEGALAQGGRLIAEEDRTPETRNLGQPGATNLT